VNPRERLAQVEAELRSIHEAAGDNPLAEEQQTQWDALTTERGQLVEAIRRDDERHSLVRSLADRPGHTEPGDGTRGAPNVNTPRDPFEVLEDRSLRGRDLTRALVDANLRAIEGRVDVSADDERHFERLLSRNAGRYPDWARSILGRSRPQYEDGWAKLVTGNGHLLSDAERSAMAVGTNTAGGYLVPTHLDPTLMLTNAGSSNIMRRLARTVTLIEGSVWHGVTTAGVTASWDGELVEVSDDTPAVGTASITAYKAQAFVQASIESFEDISSLASDVLMMFADARDRLEGAAFMTGSGSQPKGLFTSINASASLQTTSTTAAVIGEVDIHALYRALPYRWRANGTFVANPLYTLAVKRLGTAVSSSFSGDLTQPVSDRWLGRPVIESDDAPTTQTTTALDQEIVFADLNQFVIVDKPGGFSIEFVPLLFNTANNLPDGRRGWYAHWRAGSDMPNLAAGRILVDKTSA
jgi:HK97 family phage major capsid protein